MNTSRKGKHKREECLKQMSDLKEQQQRYVKLAGGLYEDYEQGLLTPEKYTFLSEEYNGKIKHYNGQLEELRKRADSYKPDFVGNKEWREKSKKYTKQESLNREMIEAFIHRIDVTDEVHIKIQMNCMDEFKKLLKMKEQRRLEFNE